MKDKTFEIGQEIWVVERECGEAVDISGVLFLATSKGCVICTSWINDYDFDEIIEYHIEETSEESGTELYVYPIDDCFETREEAERALKGE